MERKIVTWKSKAGGIVMCLGLVIISCLPIALEITHGYSLAGWMLAIVGAVHIMGK